MTRETCDVEPIENLAREVRVIREVDAEIVGHAERVMRFERLYRGQTDRLKDSELVEFRNDLVVALNRYPMDGVLDDYRRSLDEIDRTRG